MTSNSQCFRNILKTFLSTLIKLATMYFFLNYLSTASGSTYTNFSLNAFVSQTNNISIFSLSNNYVPYSTSASLASLFFCTLDSFVALQQLWLAESSSSSPERRSSSLANNFRHFPRNYKCELTETLNWAQSVHRFQAKCTDSCWWK